MKGYSNLRRCMKEDKCKSCNDIIYKYHYYFLRIIPTENYNEYKKYHIDCAKTLKDLTKEEKEELKTGEYYQRFNKDPFFKESKLLRQCMSILWRKEKQNLLSYYRCNNIIAHIEGKIKKIGRKGFPDLSIFLKNNKTIFIELKSNKGILTKEQKKIKLKLKKLGYEYYIINSSNQLLQILEYHTI